MERVVSIVFCGLFLFLNSYAQQKTFGHRIYGNGDIVSDVFLIQDGFVLDSAVSYNKTYHFKYDEAGRLKRDINFITYTVLDSATGRPIQVPGYRDYFYNESGDVDSIAYGYWNNNQWVNGISIDYIYDNNENIISKIYSSNGIATKLEENEYDVSGNLILKKEILVALKDTLSTIREYDELNRLTLIKSVKNNPSFTQRLYQYDSSGNVNCTTQLVTFEEFNNNKNYFLEIDESGKIINEILSTVFYPDSTWGSDIEAEYIYDEYSRIVKMGLYTLFHYDAAGNLDTLQFLHPNGNYLENRATFIDAYGNNITFPDYTWYNYFYYSKLVTGIKDDHSSEMNFTLYQNYPNPFNPTTTITYQLPVSCQVSLVIYDILGKEKEVLVNERKKAGLNTLNWTAEGYSSGIYIARLHAGNIYKSIKLILLK